MWTRYLNPSRLLRPRHRFVLWLVRNWYRALYRTGADAWLRTRFRRLARRLRPRHRAFLWVARSWYRVRFGSWFRSRAKHGAVALLLPAAALALLALAMPPAAHALATDREQPVRIDAQEAHIDEREGIATYRGAVVIEQGSLRIEAETVSMHLDDEQRVELLVAEGGDDEDNRYVRLQQQPDGEDATLQRAAARRIEYRVEDGVMTLTGDARITQGRFEMEAERIDYDVTTASLRGNPEDDDAGATAGTGSTGDSGQGRVSITVRPSAPR